MAAHWLALPLGPGFKIPVASGYSRPHQGYTYDSRLLSPLLVKIPVPKVMALRKNGVKGIYYVWAHPGGPGSKESAVRRETWVHSLGQEDTLEKEMATHSNILVWRIPWTEELVRLQSMGLQRVRHDLVIKQQQLCIFIC